MQVIWRGPQGGTVFVDGMRACPRTAEWKWPDSCHLYTLPGWLEDLHVFAQAIGMRRAWFQSQSVMPHYDLTAARRRRAVELGAVSVGRVDVVSAIRSWRAHENDRKAHVLREQSDTDLKDALDRAHQAGMPYLTVAEAHRVIEKCKADLCLKGAKS